MDKSNATNTSIEVGLRPEKELEEEAVNPTYYRKIVASLRYLCNTIPDLTRNVIILISI